MILLKFVLKPGLRFFHVQSASIFDIQMRTRLNYNGITLTNYSIINDGLICSQRNYNIRRIIWNITLPIAGFVLFG